MKPLTAESKSRLFGILLVLAAMVIWSTVSVGTKLLMQDGSAFSPAFISAGRLCVAAAIFVLLRVFYVRRAGIPFRVPIRHKGWLLVAAGAICFNYIFYAIGLRYTTAGATSVVSQSQAVATVLLAALLLGERLTRQKIAGMICAMLGVAFVMMKGAGTHDLLSSQYLLGNIIEIIAALSWPFFAIGQTKLLEESGSRQALMPIFVNSAVLSLFLLPFTGPLVVNTPTLTDWGVLFFLGAGSTAAAYWLFAAGLQRIETSEGAMFNVLIPLMALLMAHWVLKEDIHPNVLSGLALVLIGLVLIVWRRGYSPLRPKGRLRLRKIFPQHVLTAPGILTDARQEEV